MKIPLRRQGRSASSRATHRHLYVSHGTITGLLQRCLSKCAHAKSWREQDLKQIKALCHVFVLKRGVTPSHSIFSVCEYYTTRGLAGHTTENDLARRAACALLAMLAHVTQPGLAGSQPWLQPRLFYSLPKLYSARVQRLVAGRGSALLLLLAMRQRWCSPPRLALTAKSCALNTFLQMIFHHL